MQGVHLSFESRASIRHRDRKGMLVIPERLPAVLDCRIASHFRVVQHITMLVQGALRGFEGARIWTKWVPHRRIAPPTCHSGATTRNGIEGIEYRNRGASFNEPMVRRSWPQKTYL